MKKSRFLLVSVLLILGLVACTIPSDADEISWGDKLSSLSLSEAQVDTLQSLQQIDEYPLYTMHFYAPYETLSSVSDFRHADIPSFDST